MGAVRVLIVDDDEDDFFITSEYIKNIQGGEFTIDWCYKYKEALENVLSGNYDIYFVDYRLGAKTGLDLLKESLHNNSDVPIVLLTGKGNQKIDIEAMQAGAVDYLIKSELTTEKLERCMRYSLERAQSVRALKANERKFRNIFEKSKDAVFIADDNLFFVDVNNATSELFNLSKDELQKINLYSLMAPSFNRWMLQQQLTETGEVNDREVEFSTNSGENKYCTLSVSKETNTRGEAYVQGIIHDITNLKKTEKITLQEEKLRAAGRLVHTLAHEVRNPLNNINLSVEQLSSELNGDGKIYLDIVNRNSKRIGDLISELLHSSRPAEIILTKTSLQTIIDESVASALDRITLKKIRLKVQNASKSAYIMADSEKLKIAFLNIIINAIEAMPDEERSLKISASSNSTHHKVIISDNGSGISEENMVRLFEPYFTSKRNGLGLGLAATLNIIQSHKALIDVQSKPQQGTSFTLTFEKA